MAIQMLTLARFAPQKGDKLMKVLGLVLLLVGMTGILAASVTPAPEIDPGSAGSAIALLSGALVVLKSRRAK
jgi:hypothetical protein